MCVCVHVYKCGCVGAWVRGCVGAWVRGCVGAWVRGCVGAWGACPKIWPTYDICLDKDLASYK